MESLFFLCQPWLPARKHVPVVIVLHKKGFTGKDIAASKIAPKSNIYRIIKNFKESSSIVVKKVSGRPRKSSKRQDCLLKSTGTELAQEWQQAGKSASACTVRQRLLEDGLVSRRAAKPLLSRKNIRDRLIFCKRYRDWSAEDWGKVYPFSLMNPLSDCLWHPE